MAPLAPSLTQVARPLADELRAPLLALRTSAALLEQRPHDEALRQNLSSRFGGELGRIEAALARFERFASFGAPKLAPVDLAVLARGELERHRAAMRERALVVLEELDPAAPPVLADAEQLRFALDVLLERALRMVPIGGDLYLGSFFREEAAAGARHRLLLRFHSPEEVLVAPDDAPGAAPVLEVVFARSLVERMGGAFAVDASGLAENVVVIEL
jgi:nitrogen-specific signal transduction histidine kinase